MPREGRLGVLEWGRLKGGPFPPRVGAHATDWSGQRWNHRMAQVPISGQWAVNERSTRCRREGGNETPSLHVSFHKHNSHGLDAVSTWASWPKPAANINAVNPSCGPPHILISECLNRKKRCTARYHIHVLKNATVKSLTISFIDSHINRSAWTKSVQYRCARLPTNCQCRDVAWFKYRFPVNGQSTHNERTVNGKSTRNQREVDWLSTCSQRAVNG